MFEISFCPYRSLSVKQYPNKAHLRFCSRRTHSFWDTFRSHRQGRVRCLWEVQWENCIFCPRSAKQQEGPYRDWTDSLQTSSAYAYPLCQNWNSVSNSQSTARTLCLLWIREDSKWGHYHLMPILKAHNVITNKKEVNNNILTDLLTKFR